MRYRYPLRRLIGDYVRVGVGLVVTLVPLLVLPVIPVMFWMLLSLSVLFVALALTTVHRQLTLVDVRDTSLRTSPLGHSIRWDALSAMQLAYYSTRRDGRQGWLQLTLRAGRERIKLDSRLDGFEEVLRVAVRAAKRQALPLDAATCSNLHTLGVTVVQQHPVDARMAL